MLHQRPNQRRKREKYATEEPHKPRLIHHNSIKTHEKKTKEKRNPRRRPRMGPQRTRFVEKEPIFFFFRLSKANKLNHKCMHCFILFCILLLAYTNNLSLFYLRLWMFQLLNTKRTQILLYVTIHSISHTKYWVVSNLKMKEKYKIRCISCLWQC